MNYINLTQILGKMMKLFRENCKMSIEKVSSAAGIGVSTLERFEEGLSPHCMTETFEKIVNTCSGDEKGIPAFVRFSLTEINADMADAEKTMVSLENMVNSAYEQEISDKFRRDVSFLLNRAKKEVKDIASLCNENEKDVVEMRKKNSAFSPNAIVRVLPAKTWGIYYSIDAKTVSDILSGKTTKTTFVVLSRIMSSAWKLNEKTFDTEGMKNYGIISFSMIQKSLYEKKETLDGSEKKEKKVPKTVKKKKRKENASDRVLADGIGKYLKAFRESRGVTQVTVANSSERSRGWLHHIEQQAAGYHIYLDQVEEIARIISPEEGVSAFLGYVSMVTVERGILPSEEDREILTLMADKLQAKVPKLLQTHIRNKIETLKITEGSVAGSAKIPPKAIGRILHETGYETKASFLFRILTFLYKREGVSAPEEKAKNALAGAEIKYYVFTTAAAASVKPNTADIQAPAAALKEHTPVKVSPVVRDEKEEQKMEAGSLTGKTCTGELGSILSHLEALSGLGKNGYGIKGIKAISRNFETDAGLMFAYGQIDISPVSKKNKETKQKFLDELKELVKKYGEEEESAIDYYIV